MLRDDLLEIKMFELRLRQRLTLCLGQLRLQLNNALGLALALTFE